MKKTSKVRASLKIGFQSKRELKAILDSLRPELHHPAGEKARARISTRGKSLLIYFEANNSTLLRAIFSSYLRLLAASLRVCDSLIKLERSSRTSQQKQ
jgi:tRNA threonylcarbamoyladenosine modification (KEOPS) complex  Pcc1 subunit